MLVDFIKSKGASLLFYSLLVLLLYPVWMSDFPAMVDFPQHVTQTASLVGMLEGDALYQEHYKINWFTPYIVPNLIALFFALFSSPVIANKILVSLYIVSTPILTQQLAKFFDKPSEVCFLSLPFVYTFAFHWGFVPFLMSSAISSIWLWYYFVKNSDVGSKGNVIFSFIVMYSHAVAWGVAVFVILARMIYTKKVKDVLYKPYILLPLLPLSIWMAYVLSFEVSSTASHLILYRTWLYKMISFVASMAMGNDWYLGTIKFLLVLAAIIIFSRRKGWSEGRFVVICLCLLFFVMPNMLASIAYFSDRLLVFVPVFYALSISEVRSKITFVFFLSVATILSVVSMVKQQQEFDVEVKPLFEVVAGSIDGDSRVLFLNNAEDTGFYNYAVMPTPKIIWVPHNFTNSKRLVLEYSFAYVFPEMIRFKDVQEDRHYNAENRYKYPDLEWSKLDSLDYILIRDCSLEPLVDTAIQDQSNFVTKVSEQCWHLFEMAEG